MLACLLASHFRDATGAESKGSLPPDSLQPPSPLADHLGGRGKRSNEEAVDRCSMAEPSPLYSLDVLQHAFVEMGLLRTKEVAQVCRAWAAGAQAAHSWWRGLGQLDVSFRSVVYFPPLISL